MVSIRRYSRCHWTARSAYSCKRFGGMRSEASACLGAAVWHQPGDIDSAKTSPSRQTLISLLDIPAPGLFGSCPRTFYTSFAKITLKEDFCSPLSPPPDYNVIANQGVSVPAVWQSTCYRGLWVPESNGRRYLRFGPYAASTLADKAEQIVSSQSVRGRKQKITQHARKACRRQPPGALSVGGSLK